MTPIAAMVCAPGCQAYEVAPLAVSVVLWPAHKVEEDEETPIVGVAVTLIVTVRTTPAQEPLEPVILYTVVAEGLKTLDDPDPEGNHV